MQRWSDNKPLREVNVTVRYCPDANAAIVRYGDHTLTATSGEGLWKLFERLTQGMPNASVTPVVHETVEEFLARGGTVERVANGRSYSVGQSKALLEGLDL